MRTLEWITTLIAFPLVVSGDVIVRTKSGSVRSSTVQVSVGPNVEAFLGIPFGEPPIGKLRFRKPLPVKPWDGVYNATALPPPCYQNYTMKYYWTPNVDEMSEDCLYLNIWVPGDIEFPTKLKPILIWIYGGAFNVGSSEMDMYDGSTLASYGDVIVVSFNYRVGMFGFLTAHIEDAPGNMGLFDQLLAIKWVKANAEAFGGDPDWIVLIGESAGAMSVGFHLLSPLTKGMFKRVIMESGGPVHPKSVESRRISTELSEQIARLSGCSDDTVNLTTNPQLVVDCLKHVSPYVLSKSEGILIKTKAITAMPFWGDEYMPKSPTDLARDGLFRSTEVLIGSNTDEGSFFLSYILPEYFGVYGVNAIPKLQKRLANFIMNGIFRQTEQKNVGEIVKFYVPDSARGVDVSVNGSVDYMKKTLYNSLGDYLILCPTVFFADFLSFGTKPVYFYMFSQRPSVTYTSDWMGVTHYEEVPYVFGHPFSKDGNYTEDDKALSQRVMDRWLAFAKTGNPNIPGATEWPPYKWNNPLYLDIKVNEEVKTRPDERRCEFWRERFQSILNDSSFDAWQTSGTCTIQASIFMILTVVLFIRTGMVL